MNLKSFANCIGESQGKKRHVMLGNGFSRACRNSIFSYNSLFDEADWGADSESLRRAFDAIGTRDFEAVMEALVESAELLSVYGVSGEVPKKMKEDAAKLRTILVETLSRHHPENPGQIKEEEFAACRRFLENFERIYTVNYDLLLYWTLMKSDRNHDDGFRDPFDGEPENYVEEDFVEWKNFDNTQTIYYLHGALHLYLHGPSLKKFCWSRTGVKLKEQILSALSSRQYPLIVAAGKSEQKLAKIQRSNYLGHGFRSLAKIGGALFVYGLSMGDKDQHILSQIANNRTLTDLYVGIYGDTNEVSNKTLIGAATAIAEKKKGQVKGRKKASTFQLHFFDASSAKVWGG